MKRLAIITTHPIQYNAPLFSMISQRGKLQIKVFYTWEQSQHGSKYDPGFDREVNWDIPLLEGYEYIFVRNIAPEPGTHHFKGINNPTLIAEIENWHPEVILVFGWSFKSHLNSLKHFHNKLPVLFRGDSTLLDEKPGLKRLVRRFALRLIYRYVDLALFVGTQNKSYYLKHWLKERQLIFAPHAVDNERFIDSDGTHSAQAQNWRTQLNIPVDDLVFLYAGKLEPKKDPELLIKAFEIIYEPGIHLLIVGNGFLEKGLKSKYVFVPNLHFIDFQNQKIMPVVYRLGDVFVLPSAGPGETWGLSVNEAMACGRPVLVSDKVGCAVDLVQHGKNGYIFCAQNVMDLAEKLRLFCQKKSDIINMGNSSLVKIREWNFDSVADAIEVAVKKRND